MSQERDTLVEEGTSLRDYLIALLQKWWVVASIFGITVAAVAVISSSMPDVYETETKLLIVAPVSERLLAEQPVGEGGGRLNPVLGTNLSVDTLSALATASDLLQTIIADLDLHNSTGGPFWPVERLASMMTPHAATAGRGGAQTTLPLLTMTVRGQDPKLLKGIADKWTEAYVERNSQLFLTEATRSFEFVGSQYEVLKKDLRAKQEEKRAYIQENPLTAPQSRFKVFTAKYEDFLGQLQNKRAALVKAQARLESAEEAFRAEPQFLTLERAVSNDAIGIFLANNPTGEAVEALTNLIIKEQERNDLYFSLKSEVVSLRSSVATLNAEIAYFEARTTEFQESIEELSSRVDTIQLNLSSFDQEIGILSKNLDGLAEIRQRAQIAKEEEAGSIRIVQSAVEPRVPVGPNRLRNVFLAAILGLMLGVLIVSIGHYLQRSQAQQQEKPPPQPDKPTS